MKYFMLVSSVLMAFSVSGCIATDAIGNQLNQKTSKYTAKLTLSADALNVLKTGQLPDKEQNPLDAVLLFSAIQAGHGPGTIEFERQVAYAYIINSDIACDAYMTNVVASANNLSAGLGVGSLALSAAAALTTPVDSANILSGLSVFSNNAETEFAETMHSGKNPSQIKRAVDATRNEERARLLGLMEGDNLSSGRVGYVMAQLPGYHNRCGVVAGTDAIDQTIDQKLVNAERTGVQKANEEKSVLNATPPAPPPPPPPPADAAAPALAPATGSQSSSVGPATVTRRVVSRTAVPGTVVLTTSQPAVRTVTHPPVTRTYRRVYVNELDGE